MSMALLFFCLHVSLRMLWQTSLSVTMGVGGWGWPKNSSVVRKGQPSCPAWKAAATSAS